MTDEHEETAKELLPQIRTSLEMQIAAHEHVIAKFEEWSTVPGTAGEAKT